MVAANGHDPHHAHSELPLGRVGNMQLDLSDSVDNEWLCALILQAFACPWPVAIRCSSRITEFWWSSDSTDAGQTTGRAGRGSYVFRKKTCAKPPPRRPTSSTRLMAALESTPSWGF